MKLDQFWEVTSTTIVVQRTRVRAIGREEAKEKARSKAMEEVSSRSTLTASAAYNQWSPE